MTWWDRLFERWASFVEITETCWLWQGTRTTAGYGHLWFEGKTYIAHRVAYELFKGPFPPGFVTDHLCRVHHCVKPWDLEAVTHHVNILRSIRHGKPVFPCPHGTVKRRCKPCLAEKARGYRLHDARMVAP